MRVSHLFEVRRISADRVHRVTEQLREKLGGMFDEDTAQYRVRVEVRGFPHAADKTPWTVSYIFTPLKRGAKLIGNEHLTFAQELLHKTITKFFADKKIVVWIDDPVVYGPSRELERVETDVVWKISEL